MNNEITEQPKLPETPEEATQEIQKAEVEASPLNTFLDELKTQKSEKPEETVEEAPLDEPAQPKKLVEVKATKPDPFDGLEIDPAEKDFWNKKSPVEARQKVAALLRERNELKGKVSAAPATSYYDSDKAYILDDGFRAALSQATVAEQLEAHWAKQIELGKEGEDIQVMVEEVDDKGNPTGRVKVAPEKYKFNAQAEVYAIQQMVAARQKREAYENRAEEIKKSFATTATAIRSRIEEARKSTFAHWQKPEMAEARRPIEEHVRKVTGTGPGNPLFNILVDTVAELVQAHAALAQTPKAKPEPKPRSEGIGKGTANSGDVDALTAFLRGEAPAPEA